MVLPIRGADKIDCLWNHRSSVVLATIVHLRRYAGFHHVSITRVFRTFAVLYQIIAKPPPSVGILPTSTPYPHCLELFQHLYHSAVLAVVYTSLPVSCQQSPFDQGDFSLIVLFSYTAPPHE